MARVIEPNGPVGEATLPIRLKAYDPSKLPDPITCNGALIVINDRGNDERPRIAIALGGTWVRLAYAGEHATAPVQITSSPVNIDVTPMIRDAVRDMLPALVPRAIQPLLPALAPMAIDDDRLRTMAQAMLEFDERLKALQATSVKHGEAIEQIDQTLIPVPKVSAA